MSDSNDNQPSDTENELKADHLQKQRQNEAGGNGQGDKNPPSANKNGDGNPDENPDDEPDVNFPTGQGELDGIVEQEVGPEAALQQLAQHHRERRAERLQGNADQQTQQGNDQQNKGGNHMSLFGGLFGGVGRGVGQGLRTVGARIGDYRSKSFYAGLMAADIAFNNYVDSVSQLNNYLDQKHAGALRTLEDVAKARGKTPQELLDTMFSTDNPPIQDPEVMAARHEIKRVFDSDPHAKDLLGKVEDNLNTYTNRSLEVQDDFVKISRGKDVDVDYMKQVQENLGKQLDAVRDVAPKLTDRDLKFSQKMEEIQKKMDELMERVREATQKILRVIGLG